MARVFDTVPDELLEHAECAANWYQHHGYKVKVEPNETGFPNTPTLGCRRDATTVYVEVVGTLNVAVADNWVRYARSRTRDTRIVLAVPSGRSRDPRKEQALRDGGAGLFLCNDPGVFAFQPMDLAVNLAPPELKTLPLKLRRQLGSAYEQFEAGNWRQGFEEACKALEASARAHLRRGLKTGRVTLITKTGKPSALTLKQLDRLTIGQLAAAFGQVRAQNQTDSVVEAVLVRVNKDRVGLTHHKTKAVTETRLRKNVGSHMWEIVDALRRIG